MKTLPTGYIKVKRTINGSWVNLPVPKEGGVRYGIQTIVDDARNSLGDLVGDPVGMDKIKLEVSYPPLTDEELRVILSVFDRENGGSFKVYVEYYDPRIGRRTVRKMYVGDRSFEPWIVESETYGKPRRWVNCQCNLIEC